jgi:dTDP-4-dehydrorhamnose 3,5-epimerase-like enzyme
MREVNEATISGVEKLTLTRHLDERGYFMEVARLHENPFFADPGVKQVSFPLRLAGVTAWHVHPNQYDWWWVAQGDLQVALLDRRSGSATYQQVNEFLMGEHFDQSFWLKIPAGVAHGFKVRSSPARLLYFTSMAYTREEEGRLDPRDPELSAIYDWFKPDPVR